MILSLWTVSWNERGISSASLALGFVIIGAHVNAFVHVVRFLPRRCRLSA
jgi:hypothetical protein